MEPTDLCESKQGQEGKEGGGENFFLVLETKGTQGIVIL